MSPRPINALFSFSNEKKLTSISLRALIAGMSLCSALLAVSPDAFALSLGKITTKSFMGERLNVEIDIPDISAAEAASLQANVGGLDTFQAAGIEYNPSLAGASITLEKRPDGRQYFKVSSVAPINDPFINLVIVANWASGRIVRDYSILLDPPEALKTNATVVTAPSIANNVQANNTPTPTTTSTPDNNSKSANTKNTNTAVAKTEKQEKSSNNELEAGSQIKVERGQTAGKIAAAAKDANISLDQMLVALLRANPKAFINNNVNLIKSGAIITLPTAEEAAKVAAGEAKRTVVSQSKDFYEYSRKLAENAPSTDSNEATRTSGGKVQTQITEKRPEATATDKLVLANSKNGKSKEDAVAKELQAKEDAKRLADLSSNIKDLKQQLNPSKVASAAGNLKDQAQNMANKASAAVSQLPTVVASTVPGLANAAASQASDAGAASAATNASVASAAKVVTPIVNEYEEPSLLDGLPEYTPIAGGGILIALLGLFWWKRRSKKEEESNPDSQFFESRMHDDSFFEVSGGQQIDTSESPVSGSEPFTASQLNSVPDVDPIAEADVYLAYRRDTSAEEILKDAMIANPTRLAIPLKLLEIYAKRPDAEAFEKLAAKVKVMTNGQGLEWDRVQQLSQGLLSDTNAGQRNNYDQNNAGTPTFSDFGVSAVDSLNADINSNATPNNRNMVSMVQTTDQNGETNYDIDLDFSSGHGKSVFAPAAANDITAQAPQNIQLLDNGDPTAAVTPLPFSNKSSKNGGSSDIIDFDLSALSLDLDNGQAASPAQPYAGAQLDPSDPAMTKLALAQEFYEIGDRDSAKRTLMEVINSGSEQAQAEAKKLLAQLY